MWSCRKLTNGQLVGLPLSCPNQALGKARPTNLSHTHTHKTAGKGAWGVWLWGGWATTAWTHSRWRFPVLQPQQYLQEERSTLQLCMGGSCSFGSQFYTGPFGTGGCVLFLFCWALGSGCLCWLAPAHWQYVVFFSLLSASEVSDR